MLSGRSDVNNGCVKTCQQELSFIWQSFIISRLMNIEFQDVPAIVVSVAACPLAAVGTRMVTGSRCAQTKKHTVKSQTRLLTR